MAAASEVQGNNSLISPDRLHKIDQLREKNVGTHVPLPQLVVVGDQSSGKSSLLESLTGILFPNGQGLCTRYATQITHRRDTVQDVNISIIPGPNASDEAKAMLASYQKTVTSTTELVTQFEYILCEVNSHMGIKTKQNAKGTKTFSQDVLKIEKCGPAEDYLTVIDVPGIFRNTEHGVTTETDKTLVLDMVKRYIEQDRTIILAVLPSTVDIMTQEILNLAEKYDEAGERTLGVLTKPDLLTERTTKAVVCDLIRGKKRPLTLGYYVVRNRGADEVSDDGKQNMSYWEDLFKEEPWCHLPPDRVGIVALRERLRELLGQITDKALPKLRAEARSMLLNCKKSLDGLGFSGQTEREQQQDLCNIAGKFQKIVRDALEASYSFHQVFERDELRLITRILNTTDKFNADFTSSSHLHCFKTSNKANSDKKPEAGDKFQLKEPDPVKFPELEPIIDMEWSPIAPQGDIMSWIKCIYHGSRGVELDTRVLEELKSTLLTDVLGQYQAAMEQALFLVNLERDKKPYTLNDAFKTELHESRSLRIMNRLKRKAFEDDTVDLHAIEAIVNKKSSALSADEEIHDILESYYKIARERFVDCLYRQAVDHCLLTGPRSPLLLFSEQWVLQLDKQTLSSISGECRMVQDKREQLKKKIQDLEAAMQILR